VTPEAPRGVEEVAEGTSIAASESLATVALARARNASKITLGVVPSSSSESLTTIFLLSGEGAEVAAQDVPHPVPAPDQSTPQLTTPSRPPSPDPIAHVLEHDHSSA
nr:hypothetical protein [Tanacetum cinerariifolium]